MEAIMELLGSMRRIMRHTQENIQHTGWFPVMVILLLMSNSTLQLNVHTFDDVLQGLKQTPHPKVLETVFAPFSNKHCYAIVRNHLNADLVHSTIPSINQRFIPKLGIVRFDLGAFYVLTEWIPVNSGYKHVNAVSHSANTTTGCNSMYFVATVPVYSNQIQPCISIQNNIWGLSGRPGNCKIIIDFLMPSFMTKNNRYYPLSEKISSHWAPSLPQIEILFPILRANSNRNNSLIADWVRVKQSTPEQRPTIHVNYVIYIPVNETQVLEVFKVRFVVSEQVFKNEKIILSAWSSLKTTAMKDLDIESEMQLHHWYLGESTYGLVGDQQIPKTRIPTSLFFCSADLSPNTLLGGEFANQKRVFMMDTAHAHIVQLLMGNFSYYPCFTQEEESPSYVASNIYIYPYDENGNLSILPLLILNNSLLNFRFIVSTDRGSQQHEFYQLTNAFEFQAWLLILVTLFAATVGLSQLQNMFKYHKFADSVVQMYSMIVEQGTPFPTRITTSWRNRFLLVCVLLAGIVLSNAYKNVNVYKMTQARSPLKYQLLEELMNDSFILCSRIGIAQFYVKHWRSKDFKYHEWRTAYATPTGFHGSPSGLLTLFGFEISAYYQLEFTFDDPQETNFNLPIVPIMPHAESIRMLVASLGITTETRYLPKNWQIRMTYRSMEDRALLGTLRSNSKVAVLMPEVLAIKYKKMFRVNRWERLDMGREILKTSPSAIRYGGAIKRSNLERIHTIQESGMLQKWESLYSFDVNKEAATEREDVFAANLQGNILIIFVLLFVGIQVAILFFCIEISSG